MADLYPCFCSGKQKRCLCVPGGAKHGKDQKLSAHLKNKSKPGKAHCLDSRLRIAAEYWQDHLEEHWATRWGTGRVLQLIGRVTGSTPETAFQIRGKQLTRIAITSILGRPGDSNEFQTLIPLAIHRRRVVRVLLQKVSPDFEFLLKETPREEKLLNLRSPIMSPKPHFQQENKRREDLSVIGQHLEDGRKEIHKSRQPIVAPQGQQGQERGQQQGHKTASQTVARASDAQTNDVVRAVRSIEPFPVLSASGPTCVFPDQQHRLTVGISTPEFLVAQAEAPNSRDEPKSLEKGSSPLQAGAPLVIIPRFKDDAMTCNPVKQSFKWLREQHEFEFDIQWSSYKSREETPKEPSARLATPEIEGTIEFWVGPILVAEQAFAAQHGEEGDLLLGDRRWTRYFSMFQTVLLAYSPRDAGLLYAVGRSEQKLQGCVSVLHTHQQGDGLNYFLTSRDSPEQKNIQICLSQTSQDCPQFLHSAELLAQSISRSGGKPNQDRWEIPHLTAMFWSHPKPDCVGHPVLSQVLRRMDATVFYNDWLVDLPMTLGEAGFQTRDIHNVAKQLLPGVLVGFKDYEGRWERGRIVSVSPSCELNFNVVSDASGGLFRDVPMEDIRILNEDSALSGQQIDLSQENKANGAGEGGSSSSPISKSKSTLIPSSAEQQKKPLSTKELLTTLNPGDFCFARQHQHQEYLPGIIVSVHVAQKAVDVAFENGLAQSYVPIRNVRLPPRTGLVGGRHSSAARRRRRVEQKNDFRSEETGKLAHGMLVQVANAHDGMRVLGRIRRAREFGLKYDVMLSNGEIVHGVPVHLIFNVDDEAGTSSQKGQTNGRSYVDAMCDRFREVLGRSARERPDGRDLRLQFDAMDTGGNGYLGPQEMMASLQKLGFRPSEREVLSFIDRMSGKQRVEYGEFVRFALPMGVVEKERVLKKSVAFYEAALNSVGLVSELELRVGNNIGKVWTAFVERDESNVGFLPEGEFVRCLLHVNIALTTEQRAHLCQCFARPDGSLDYREFASVVEVLLAQRVEQLSTEHSAALKKANQANQEARGQGTAANVVRNGDARSQRFERLLAENKAALLIQSLLRRRRAKKAAASLRRGQERKANEALEMSRVDHARQSSWWHVTRSETAQAVEPGEDVLKWRKLLKLNSNNGLEVGPLFRSMDRNCDGLISLQELSDALKRHGFDNSCSALLFREMDHDNDGVIDLADMKLFIAGARRATAVDPHGMPKLTKSASQSSVASDKSTPGSASKQKSKASQKGANAAGISLVIDALGRELCDKMRRFHIVLQRCGTDLLDLLTRRPVNLRITTILRKQGFVLFDAEWRRLETFIVHTADRRSDRSVCESLVAMLRASDAKINSVETDAQERSIRDYLITRQPASSKAKGGNLGALGRICHKISTGVRTLCSDTQRQEEKHKVLWWLLTINESGASLTMDRLDLEIFLELIETRTIGLEIQQLFDALDESQTGCFRCSDLAKMIGISRKVQDYLELDYVFSRFCKSAVATQRVQAGLQQGYRSSIVSEDLELSAQQIARRKGMEAYAQWLMEALGANCCKRLRALLMASSKRGNKLTSGQWLAERYRARMGFVPATTFERSLHELGLQVTNIEARALTRAVLHRSSDEVDLFEFADLCQVLVAKRLIDLAQAGGAPTDGAKHSTASSRGRLNASGTGQDDSSYLVSILQSHIRQPGGHRNVVKVFKSFDKQRDGTLTQSELEMALKALGADTSKFSVSDLIVRNDRNGDRRLDYGEFLGAIGVLRAGKKAGSAPALSAEEKIVEELLPAVRTNKLCREDVQDACSRVKTKGRVNRDQILKVFKNLGIDSEQVHDKYISTLVNMSIKQLERLLERAVTSKVRLVSSSKPKVLQDGSNVKSKIGIDSFVSGSVLDNVSIRITSGPHVGVSGVVEKYNRLNKTYALRLKGLTGDTTTQAVRDAFVIEAGRPAMCVGIMVVDNLSKGKGSVVKVHEPDNTKIDVCINSKVVRNVDVSKFTLYNGERSDLKPGHKLEALHPVDNLYYPATVLSISRDGSIAIGYEHGEKLTGLSALNLRPKKLI